MEKSRNEGELICQAHGLIKNVQCNTCNVKMCKQCMCDHFSVCGPQFEVRLLPKEEDLLKEKCNESLTRINKLSKEFQEVREKMMKLLMNHEQSSVLLEIQEMIRQVVVEIEQYEKDDHKVHLEINQTISSICKAEIKTATLKENYETLLDCVTQSANRKEKIILKQEEINQGEIKALELFHNECSEAMLTYSKTLDAINAKKKYSKIGLTMKYMQQLEDLKKYALEQKIKLQEFINKITENKNSVEKQQQQATTLQMQIEENVKILEKIRLNYKKFYLCQNCSEPLNIPACTACKKIICSSCISDCLSCSNHFCKKCVKYCPECIHYYCLDCVGKHECYSNSIRLPKDTQYIYCTECMQD